MGGGISFLFGPGTEVDSLSPRIDLSIYTGHTLPVVYRALRAVKVNPATCALKSDDPLPAPVRGRPLTIFYDPATHRVRGVLPYA